MRERLQLHLSIPVQGCVRVGESSRTTGACLDPRLVTFRHKNQIQPLREQTDFLCLPKGETTFLYRPKHTHTHTLSCGFLIGNQQSAAITPEACPPPLSLPPHQEKAVRVRTVGRRPTETLRRKPRGQVRVKTLRTAWSVNLLL